MRKKQIFCKLIVAFKSTASHVSNIGLDRVTVSVLSRIIDSDNMGLVEIKHSDVGISNR